ncbi:MAG: YafY family transcriptional regulator [Bacteroidetes bacterium]|nr:YafY family transcriptional regulator [Bacteroidota bacterium]
MKNDLNRFDRLIGILLVLQSGPVVRAADLASRFGVSIRTIYRDLRSLEAAGVPLAAEAGDGYRLVQGYQLPPVMFSPSESVALMTAIRLSEGLTDDSQKASLDTARHKILSILPHHLKESVNRLHQSVLVYEPLGSVSTIQQPRMDAIQQAILSQLILAIDYQSGGGKTVTHRQIEPYGLFYFSNRWHLIAWCRLRRDFRDFRLDRIRSLSITEETFRKDPAFHLHSFLDSQSEPSGTATFTFRTDIQTATVIRNQFWMGISDWEESDGLVTITYTSQQLDWMARWILQFGNRVRILGPESAKELVREELIRLTDHYR